MSLLRALSLAAALQCKMAAVDGRPLETIGEKLLLHPSAMHAAQSWVWPLKCIEAFEAVQRRVKAHDLPAVATKRSVFAPRTSQYQCFRAATTPCFRAVHDGFLSTAEAGAALEALGTEHADTALCDGAACVSVHKRELHGALGRLVNRTIDLFAEHHGIRGLQLVKMNFNTDDAAHSARGYSAPPVHSDFHYMLDTERLGRQLVYSGLLYLSDNTVEDGGATTFIDELGVSMQEQEQQQQQHRLAMKKGLSVQPSVGRLALFSAGAENVHIGEALLRKAKRKVLVLFFHCKIMRSGSGTLSGAMDSAADKEIGGDDDDDARRDPELAEL